MLGRVVAPDLEAHTAEQTSENLALILHDKSYGITSDPLTQVCRKRQYAFTTSCCIAILRNFSVTSQFACFFCAMIHDVGK
jgi:hypothetical protein